MACLVVIPVLLALVIPVADASKSGGVAIVDHASLLQIKGSNSEVNESTEQSQFNASEGLIPKILHQLAPANQSQWPYAWSVCQQSWKRNYPDWEYRLWNDDDALNLVKTKYPEHLWWYIAMPENIQRVDAARAFILHQYGGLYADMDYYCYKPLEIPATGQAVLVESNAGQEIVQNSLMASPPRQPFWNITFEAMSSYYKQHPLAPDPASDLPAYDEYVIESTGPNMLKRALIGQEAMVAKLDRIQYNPSMVESPSCTPESCYTRHLYTGCWAPGTKCDGYQREIETEEHLNQQIVMGMAQAAVATHNKTLCPPGTYLLDGQCAMCPPGTFKSRLGNSLGDCNQNYSQKLEHPSLIQINSSILGPYLDAWQRALP